MPSCLKTFVACNVYVSVGRPCHCPVLLDILRRAQERCRSLRHRLPCEGKDNVHADDGIARDSTHAPRDGAKNKVAIVHAYADGPYDRSSFHLAGRADLVADVAILIARTALTSLSLSSSLSPFPPTATARPSGRSIDDATIVEESKASESESRHPFVGLVDHVAVMPLGYGGDLSVQSTEEMFESVSDIGCNPATFLPPDPKGRVAMAIGNALTGMGVKTHFYGSADPNHTPLATVRRESTTFFQSGGLTRGEKGDGGGDVHRYEGSGANWPFGVATVGSPPTFVENFNIRLSSHCTRKVTASLARAVRERDGGLLGVEALTLPYSRGRYEVACNLLRPDVGSASNVLRRVEEWERAMCRQRTDGADCAHLVEDAYRVGTTEKQCVDVLGRTDMDRYDVEVRDRFERFLEQEPAKDSIDSAK